MKLKISYNPYKRDVILFDILMDLMDIIFYEPFKEKKLLLEEVVELVMPQQGVTGNLTLSHILFVGLIEYIIHQKNTQVSHMMVMNYSYIIMNLPTIRKPWFLMRVLCGRKLWKTRYTPCMIIKYMNWFINHLAIEK